MNKHAQEIASEWADLEKDRIWKEIAEGEHNSDILNAVDGGDLVAIALAIVSGDPELELSRCQNAIDDFKCSLEGYVEDLARDRT